MTQLTNPTNEPELSLIDAIVYQAVGDNEVLAATIKSNIQAYTNAEIAKVLDRLEAQWGETIDNTLGKPIRIKFVSVDAVQAERNRLNPSKSTPFNKLKER